MKKVIAIAPYSFLPYFSGGQKFIANFFEHLATQVDLTVVSVASNDASLARNYKIIPLLKPSFSRYYDRSLIKKITDLVQQEKFEAIIWEHPYYSWLAKKIKKNTGIKTIIHTHNIEYQRFRSMGKLWWPILRGYEKKCLQRADAVLFITPEDKNFAISHWRLDPTKCVDVPFGIDKIPDDNARSSARNVICQKHAINSSEKILLFTGLLKYRPNYDAVKAIIDEVNPHLLNQSSFSYKIIICGKDLPENFKGLKDYADKNIIYAGFVDDIDPYFKAADVFLNPVMTGGGVKTKMVEAIGFGTTVVSTETGAAGIDKSVCGNKLVIVADKDWRAFADAIVKASNQPYSPTPNEYFEMYSWENIIPRVVDAL